MTCKIVCASACRNCDKTPCEDRIAEEDTEGKLHIAAAQAVAMSSTGLYEFWDGRKGGKGTTIPNIYEDEILEPRMQQAMAKVIELEAVRHCGMRSDLSCRICHDDTCRVRMAKRTF
jgi:hypothetical protein